MKGGKEKKVTRRQIFKRSPLPSISPGPNFDAIFTLGTANPPNFTVAQKKKKEWFSPCFTGANAFKDLLESIHLSLSLSLTLTWEDFLSSLHRTWLNLKVKELAKAQTLYPECGFLIVSPEALCVSHPPKGSITIHWLVILTPLTLMEMDCTTVVTTPHIFLDFFFLFLLLA